MKEFILALFFTVIIICGAVVSCESSKEEKLSREKLFELSERCSKAGKLYFQDFVRETNVSGFSVKSQYSWDDPEYHYNSRLNTCLIHIRYIEFDKFNIAITTHYNQVVDIFSNKTILRGWFTRDVSDKNATKETIIDMNDGIPNYTSIEYYKQKNKLFSE